MINFCHCKSYSQTQGMILLINGTEYDVPFDPSLITLGQYIEYYEQYGQKLDEKIVEIIQDKETTDDEKLIKLDAIVDEEAISWFSFWTKLDLFKAKDLPDIQPVLSSYRIFRYLLKSAEEDCKLPFRVNWNDEEWEIQDFKVNPASKMSFNEVVTSKDMEEQVKKMNLGKFVALLYLSVIFFRKVGENFTDEMIHEDSERLNLMKTLPMSYALNVSFFLSVCVAFWRTTLLSSKELEVA